MRFDLRTPIGALFVIYGLLLSVYGLFGDPAQYARSLGINVNLIWGSVLLLAGATLLAFGLRRGRG